MEMVIQTYLRKETCIPPIKNKIRTLNLKKKMYAFFYHECLQALQNIPVGYCWILFIIEFTPMHYKLHNISITVF